MPGRTLPELTAATTLAETDLTYATVTSGASRKITVANLRAVLAARAIARYYMHGNVTATTIAVAGTYYPVAGTTTSGSAVVGFTQTSNAATLTQLGGVFYAIAVLAVSGGNNQLVSARLAVNGVPLMSAEGETTTETGARASIVVQDVVTLSPGDTLSVMITNATGTTAITAVDLSLVAHRV